MDQVVPRQRRRLEERVQVSVMRRDLRDRKRQEDASTHIEHHERGRLKHMWGSRARDRGEHYHSW